MSLDNNLSLRRSGDELFVCGSRTSIGPKLFGGAFAGFSLFWIFEWNRHDAGNDLAYAGGYLLAAVFVFVGVSFALPKSVMTIFDLQSRQVRRSVTTFNRWPLRRDTYSFEAVSGLGVMWSKDDEDDLIPVLVLKNGTRVPLAPLWSFSRTTTSFAACEKSIDVICAETRLAKLEDLQ